VLEALTSPAAQQWVLEQGLAIPSRTELADNPFFLEETAEAQANATVFRGAADGNVLGFQFGNIGTDWMTPSTTPSWRS
jgi:multiple sugar transport system substrate-binding protein